MGMTLRDLKFNVHAHPTVAEVGTGWGTAGGGGGGGGGAAQGAWQEWERCWLRLPACAVCVPPPMSQSWLHPTPLPSEPLRLTSPPTNRPHPTPPLTQVNEELIRHAVLENVGSVKPAAAKQPVAA